MASGMNGLGGMNAHINASESLAFDSKGLDALRQSAKDNSPESLKAAATQFEALFVGMLLKSMRQAGGQEGMFDNEQSRMYTTMLDQQLSQKMASRGIGLADAMVRQLSQQSMLQALNSEDGAMTSSLGAVNQYAFQQKNGVRPVQQGEGFDAVSSSRQVQEFTQKLSQHAAQVSASSGIPAKFMLGQAALESGWGRREIKGADGSLSHNLFGIKAGGSWHGKTVEAMTTEYVNGVGYQKIEKFRAYDSYADSFRDYAKLITENPRYQDVLRSAGDAVQFAQALQKAGYATDPAYAQKLTKVIQQSLAG